MPPDWTFLMLRGQRGDPSRVLSPISQLIVPGRVLAQQSFPGHWPSSTLVASNQAGDY